MRTLQLQELRQYEYKIGFASDATDIFIWIYVDGQYSKNKLFVEKTPPASLTKVLV